MKDTALWIYYLKKGLYTRWLWLAAGIIGIALILVSINLVFIFTMKTDIDQAQLDSYYFFQLVSILGTFTFFGMILSLVGGGMAASSLRQTELEIFLAKPISRSELFGTLTGAHLLIPVLYWLLTSIIIVGLMAKFDIHPNAQITAMFFLNLFNYLIPFSIMLLVGSRLGNFMAVSLYFFTSLYPPLIHSIQQLISHRKWYHTIYEFPLILIPETERFDLFQKHLTASSIDVDILMPMTYGFAWVIFLMLSSLFLFVRVEIPGGVG